tara:strand:+ start:56 stop:313 length:258 start_codon:yes stop_codon:yes gene_type:complete
MYRLLNWSVKCGVKKCLKSLANESYVYVKDQSFFGEKPLIMCKLCYSKNLSEDKVQFEHKIVQKSRYKEYGNSPWERFKVVSKAF